VAPPRYGDGDDDDEDDGATTTTTTTTTRISKTLSATARRATKSTLMADGDNDDDPHCENFECDGATGNKVDVDGEQQRRWRLV
jgi:hypothetical protein